MSHARQMIAQLDRQIAKKGQTIRLQRKGDRDETRFQPFRASVRGYSPNELNGGIAQGDSEVVISPTALAAAGITAPISTGDRLHIGGLPRRVEFCNPIYLNDIIVRYDAWVKGGI